MIGDRQTGRQMDRQTLDNRQVDRQTQTGRSIGRVSRQMDGWTDKKRFILSNWLKHLWGPASLGSGGQASRLESQAKAEADIAILRQNVFFFMETPGLLLRSFN